MELLLDTNVLLRIADSGSPQHATAFRAYEILETQGVALTIVPQIVYEFWVVATRPRSVHGLGMTTVEAARTIDQWPRIYRLRLDQPGIYGHWTSLVRSLAVHGKTAHDTRLVAAMQQHSISHLLTFNTSDFARYPGIVVWDPADVVAGRIQF